MLFGSDGFQKGVHQALKSFLTEFGIDLNLGYQQTVGPHFLRLFDGAPRGDVILFEIVKKLRCHAFFSVESEHRLLVGGWDEDDAFALHA
jgi:hypothetical protein